MTKTQWLFVYFLFALLIVSLALLVFNGDASAARLPPIFMHRVYFALVTCVACPTGDVPGPDFCTPPVAP